MSSYTWEKICNLKDHCNHDCNSSLELSDLTHERNDDCNASLEFRMQILERRNKFVYKHTSAQVQMSRYAPPPKRWFGCFCVHTQNSHCNLSETSLEFTSGLEFEGLHTGIKSSARMMIPVKNNSNDEFLARVYAN